MRTEKFIYVTMVISYLHVAHWLLTSVTMAEALGCNSDNTGLQQDISQLLNYMYLSENSKFKLESRGLTEKTVLDSLICGRPGESVNLSVFSKYGVNCSAGVRSNADYQCWYIYPVRGEVVHSDIMAHFPNMKFIPPPPPKMYSHIKEREHEMDQYRALNQYSCACVSMSAQVLDRFLDEYFRSENDDCHSPAGNDCNWYERCLEKRFPCKEENEISYALDYGLKYCKRFGERRNKFTIDGQEWIDKVRKCLQVRLAPILKRDRVEVSCATIKDTAFRQHSKCYVDFGYCDLPCNDWIETILTVGKGIFSKESIRQIYDVGLACGGHSKSRRFVDDGCLSTSTRVLTVILSSTLTRAIVGRSTETMCDESCVAEKVVNQISYELGWNSVGIVYTAFGEENLNGGIDVQLLLTRRPLINEDGGNSTAGLDAAEAELIEYVETSEIKVDEWKVEKILVSSLSNVFENEQENSTLHNIMAKTSPTRTSNNAQSVYATAGMILGYTAALLLSYQ